MWCSNAPFVPTGYGNQTKLFAHRLQALLGHTVAVHAFHGLQGSPIRANGLMILPGINPDYGQSDLAEHARSMPADVAIPFMDAWVLKPQLYGDVPFCPWFPVDHEPLPPPVARALEGRGDRGPNGGHDHPAFRPIVYSAFGERMMQAAGLDCRYVPHGVDTAIYSPGNKAAARGRTGLPKDKFVVGMVAANKGGADGLPGFGYTRKALPQQIEAFARFHARHPDSFLYLHMLDGRGGGDMVNVREIIDHFGLADSAGQPNQYHYAAGGFTDAMMADIYRSMDTLLSVSCGEGFGIPILEAQACGVPVLVGDWTSMGELCFMGGMVEQADADRIWTAMGAFQWLPRVEAIAEALELAYRAPPTDGERALCAVRVAEYDADRITRDYWRPVLDEIAADLGLPATTVPNGQPNRAERRALARVK